MSDEVINELSPAQFDMVDDTKEYVAIIGAKGSGKTYAGVLFACQMMASRPGSRGLLIWNTYQQSFAIWNQDLKPMLDKLKWKYTFNETKMILRCFGCEVHLRTADLSSMKENVESISFHWGWGDEVSFWSYESFDIFNTRVRLDQLNGEYYLPLTRVTSMPDEPDSWIYNKLSALGYVVHEVGLRSNPNSDWARRYEIKLRAIYQGEQLRRYLDGERVSVAGVGLFAIKNEQQGNYPYRSDIDLLVCWDFNNEYRAVTWWQKVGKTETGMDIVACVNSFQMKCATVGLDAEEQAGMLKTHTANVYLHGDASGANKTAMATESMWQSVQTAYYSAIGNRLRFIVPKANPPVKDTIECANWALHNDLIRFDSAARKCYLSMLACHADKYGEIDKSVDYKAGATRTHEADTARYAIWHFFQYLYPGNRNNYYLV